MFGQEFLFVRKQVLLPTTDLSDSISGKERINRINLFRATIVPLFGQRLSRFTRHATMVPVETTVPPTVFTLSVFSSAQPIKVKRRVLVMVRMAIILCIRITNVGSGNRIG